MIFLSKKVIETVTVHENGCNNLFLRCIETNRWICFTKKSYFYLILIRMFCLLKLSYLNIFTIKVNGNHHSGRGKGTYWLIYITVWILCRRKLYYFNDLIAIRVFFLLQFQYPKVTETVNVHENRCLNSFLLFWD